MKSCEEKAAMIMPFRRNSDSQMCYRTYCIVMVLEIHIRVVSESYMAGSSFQVFAYRWYDTFNSWNTACQLRLLHFYFLELKFLLNNISFLMNFNTIFKKKRDNKEFLLTFFFPFIIVLLNAAYNNNNIEHPVWALVERISKNNHPVIWENQIFFILLLHYTIELDNQLKLNEQHLLDLLKRIRYAYAHLIMVNI